MNSVTNRSQYLGNSPGMYQDRESYCLLSRIRRCRRERSGRGKVALSSWVKCGSSGAVRSRESLAGQGLLSDYRIQRRPYQRHPPSSFHQLTSIHLSDYCHRFGVIHRYRYHRASLLHLWLGFHQSRFLRSKSLRSASRQSRLRRSKCHPIPTIQMTDHQTNRRRSIGHQGRTSDASSNGTTKGKDVDNG